MAKTLVLIIFISLIFSLQSCGQKTETYWKAENVSKVNKTPINAGVRMAYMTMIEEMQIHLSKKNDSLFIVYPAMRIMKEKDFTSLSNVHYADNENKLLDSIYDISINNDSLRIKFYFGGTQNDNRYVLTFSPIEKQLFIQETQKLQLEKNQLFELLNTVDYSSLDLSTSKPKYFSDEFDLNILNPVQFAEMISVNNEGIQTGIEQHSFNIQKYGNLKYTEYYIQRSDLLDFTAARIANVNFNNIKLIYNNIINKTDAIILYQQQLANKDINQLFKTINSKLDNAVINKENLYSLEISWTDKHKIVKMIISNTSDNRNITDEILLNIGNAKTHLNIEKEIESYIHALEDSETKITIVSKELAEISKSEEFKTKLGGMPFTVDYNH